MTCYIAATTKALPSKSIHFRSIDGGLTLCRLESSRIANANLPSTPHIALVTCRGCLIQFKHEQRRAQQRAAQVEPLPITRMPADLATKADIANLKAQLIQLAEQVRALRTDLHSATPPPRYMGIGACATYIGRSIEAVRCLVKRRQIPSIKVGGKLQFDRNRIDAWMGLHAKREDGVSFNHGSGRTSGRHLGLEND